MTQTNSKLSVAGGAARYNDNYNDIAMITSAVPFAIMQKFLELSLQKMDQFLLANMVHDHEIRITFYPSKNEDLEEGLRIIRKDKKEAPVMFDISSARVQFHFYKTYRDSDDAEQRFKNELYHRLWGDLSCIPEKVFDQLLLPAETEY